MRAGEVKLKIQQLLGLPENLQAENIGPVTRAAFDKLAGTENNVQWPIEHKVNLVKASSFADPADIRAFKRCKAEGGSDQACFKVGDNGIGVWGDDTTKPIPMCALPREDWKPFGTTARGKRVLVQIKDKSVICELRDTMPSKANIKNGAGIDLNPAACAALGLKSPILTAATWQWV